MKIVIDIDDDMYKSVVNNDAYVLGDADWILFENAIANGTPLPKHHGRLGDLDAIQKYQIDTFGQRLLVIDTAPTIIEGSESE